MTEIIQRFINAADEFHKRGACHVKTLLAFDSKTGKLRAWQWAELIHGWVTRNISEGETPPTAQTSQGSVQEL